MRRHFPALLALLAVGFALRAPASRAQAAAVAPATTSAPVVRVFQIQHADMAEVSLVIPTLLSDGNVLTVDNKTHTVTVVDRQEFVDRVEIWLLQFDVPPDQVLVRIVLEKAERSGAHEFVEFDVGGARVGDLPRHELHEANVLRDRLLPDIVAG